MGKLVSFKEYVKLQEYERSIGGFNFDIFDFLKTLPKAIGGIWKFTKVTFPQFRDIIKTYNEYFGPLKVSYRKMIDSIPEAAKLKSESEMAVSLAGDDEKYTSIENISAYKDIMKHEREFVRHISDFVKIIEANPLIKGVADIFGLSDPRVLFSYVASDNFVKHWNEGESNDDYKLLTLRELETSTGPSVRGQSTIINYFKRRARMDMISEISGSRIWSAPIPVAPTQQTSQPTSLSIGGTRSSTIQQKTPPSSTTD